ncbi:PTS system maltose-specific IIB component, Glc family /PTS system maltose-specific IIC component, Glc family [Pelagirhabdus alkalitolerans]|uniref:PTS system maltose-specific IIB component, Glc family /PTS system maltose-specific IIC component, Glc family n=1 Tax=Pelagirhabdus alkalitolerans TaxID=1612202 RepID=A0A1G6KXI4_9BACI|nr:alpha-glucoside-specific PTS transporter subunit IIBC [Pelagirhabdus alkalitolerans]SDC35809.1 PTS system maltose-specific IIB component, Glc family /PTS system maltose-specific IIC component, Glc family [Pelagirhabdus alkalitolerans]
MLNSLKEKVQRFGGAMFFPALLLPFAGILLGLSVILQNDQLFPFATEGSTYTQIIGILEQTSLVIFNNLPMIFVLGIPITLATKESGRATLTAFITYLTYNYFMGATLSAFGPTFGVDNFEPGELGLTEIAGVLTLDTNLIGAILAASLAVWIHNKYYDFEVPNMLQSFKGTPLVVIILFPITILAGIVTLIVWPTIQSGIFNMQSFMVESGVFGVWTFTFLERILIPTGLHHFIYGPVFYGPIAIDGGTVNYWIQNLSDFANSTDSLTSLFPQGGLMLTGMGKTFGTTGAAIAMYLTAKPENKKKVLGLLIPAVVTAILTGITEPIEFTFLFIAPLLFAVHAFLSATMASVLYVLGLSGNFQTGFIDFIFQNWLPLGGNHYMIYIIQFLVGLGFMALYVVIFSALIKKFDFKTPGRSDDLSLKTKKDYKASKKDGESTGSVDQDLASAYLEALGSKDNIESVTNCATRLRVKVKDPEQVESDAVFMDIGAAGVVRSGQNLQVIVGLRVPQVRGYIEELIK